MKYILLFILLVLIIFLLLVIVKRKENLNNCEINNCGDIKDEDKCLSCDNCGIYTDRRNYKYCTNGNNIRFNPNLYTCGKVCVSLLNTWRGDQWTSCQSISTVLLTLCTLLCKDPLLNEPGVSKSHEDMSSYDEIIQIANLDIAICSILQKKEGIFLPFFENFFPYVKENFLKNYDKLMEFAEKKNAEFGGESKQFSTRYYSMRITANYKKVINRLKEKMCIMVNNNTFIINFVEEPDKLNATKFKLDLINSNFGINYNINKC